MTSKSPLTGVQHALQELAKDHERVVGQIAPFAARLERDPIAALDLRFTEAEGFVGKPFAFKGRFLTGDLHLIRSLPEGPAPAWIPEEHVEGPAKVKPVGSFVAAWGIGVAVKVAHDEPEFRLKLGWVKAADPASSPVYLVDPVNHQYLRPIASSLKGEVLSGIPRIGIVIFELPALPTNRLQLHFSNLPLTPQRGERSSFQFEFSDPRLLKNLETVNDWPGVAESIERLLEQEVEKVRTDYLKGQKGCAFAAVSLLGSMFTLSRWMT